MYHCFTIYASNIINIQQKTEHLIPQNPKKCKPLNPRITYQQCSPSFTHYSPGGGSARFSSSSWIVLSFPVSSFSFSLFSFFNSSSSSSTKKFSLKVTKRNKHLYHNNQLQNTIASHKHKQTMKIFEIMNFITL